MKNNTDSRLRRLSSFETFLCKRLPDSVKGDIGAFLRLSGYCKEGLKTLGFTENCCWPGSYQEGNLTIYCHSSAWASLLRYRMQELHTYLAYQKQEETSLPPVRTMKVVLASPIIPKVQDFFQPARVSHATVETLYRTAVEVTNPQLKSALYRLAQHYARHTDSDNN